MLRRAGLAGSVLLAVGIALFVVTGQVQTSSGAPMVMILGAICAILGLILNLGAFTTWLITGMAGVTDTKDDT